MPIQQETSQEVLTRIENVVSGKTFAEANHFRLYGDVNPNYTREFIHRTNHAVRAARCLFKIADVVERGTEDQELYFGIPYNLGLGKVENGMPELQENSIACRLAQKAKLLNSKEIQKENITRHKFDLSYHGKKLVETNDSEMAYATPIIKTLSFAGCLGSLALTTTSLYLADKVGHEVFDFSNVDVITDVMLHTSIGIHGLLFSRLGGLFANDARGNLRAKRVHKDFLKYATDILNDDNNPKQD